MSARTFLVLRGLDLSGVAFVSSSDFRQIAFKSEAGKAERLFRAAVSAFCSLTRPSRREIAQLEDLTLPLFDFVSVDARRYVSAALSECEHAPPALVRRLCEEPVEVAAALLVRSPVLRDVDLIALIGRHGIRHARAIARRPDLNPAIADLIRALERPMLVRSRGPEGERRETPEKPTNEALDNASASPKGMRAEMARRQLQTIMVAAETGRSDASASEIHARLRKTALSGNLALFQAAIAGALDLDVHTARSITATTSYMPLMSALRALDIGEDQAFVIVAAAFASNFTGPEAVRLFLDRYRLLSRETALERVNTWKSNAAGASAANSSTAQATQAATQLDASILQRVRAS